MQTTPNYPDIYFAPAYQELFKDTAFGGDPRVYSDLGIEYRYYLRPIPDSNYFDITSVYGYGGPIAIKDQTNWPLFLDNFHAHCMLNGIVSEFTRLNPF